jgi:hypothetical protein
VNWFPVFLCLWAAGIFGALSLLPPGRLGPRFFRFNVAIPLALVTIAIAVGRPFFGDAPVGSMTFLIHFMTWVLAVDVAVVSFLAFIPRRLLPGVALLLPVITGALFAVAVAFAVGEGKPGPSALLTLHFLTAATLIGSVLVAMNLGHAYLQDAALPFDFLERLANLFLGAAVAKTAVSAALLAPAAVRLWPGLLDSFDGMLVVVRVVPGLAAPIVLGLMVRSCARAKANQSATGILYAALVFVIVGEAVSMHLTLGRGIHA